MFAYENFIRDFPTRCYEILDKYENDARSRGREVTLMLAIATSGLVVPFERLRPRTEKTPYHDRSNYTQAVSQFDGLLEENFLGSQLWKSDVGSWSFGELRDVTGDPDAWKELQDPLTPLGRYKKVNTILKHLRNALTHGNIFTRGKPDIKLIIFLSQPDPAIPRFNFLCVSLQDFRGFLKNWFMFIKELKLPTEVLSSVVKDAA